MKGSHGNDIECYNPKQIMIDDNIAFEVLKEKIRGKLKLTPDQEVTRIAYRCSIGFSPLQFQIIRIEDDLDVELMIEAHKENDAVLQVIQIGVFVFDAMKMQQISCL